MEQTWDPDDEDDCDLFTSFADLRASEEFFRCDSNSEYDVHDNLLRPTLSECEQYLFGDTNIDQASNEFEVVSALCKQRNYAVGESKPTLQEFYDSDNHIPSGVLQIGSITGTLDSKRTWKTPETKSKYLSVRNKVILLDENYFKLTESSSANSSNSNITCTTNDIINGPNNDGDVGGGGDNNHNISDIVDEKDLPLLFPSIFVREPSKKSEKPSISQLGNQTKVNKVVNDKGISVNENKEALQNDVADSSTDFGISSSKITNSTKKSKNNRKELFIENLNSMKLYTPRELYALKKKQ